MSNSHFHLVLRLRMGGAISLTSHTCIFFPPEKCLTWQNSCFGVHVMVTASQKMCVWSILNYWMLTHVCGLFYFYYIHKQFSQAFHSKISCIACGRLYIHLQDIHFTWFTFCNVDKYHMAYKQTACMRYHDICKEYILCIIQHNINQISKTLGTQLSS